MDASIVIEAFHIFDKAVDDPDDIALDMLADIQKAIELEDDERLGNLLQSKIELLSDKVIYPKDTQDIVVSVAEYSIDYIRYYGKPDS